MCIYFFIVSRSEEQEMPPCWCGTYENTDKMNKSMTQKRNGQVIIVR